MGRLLWRKRKRRKLDKVESMGVEFKDSELYFRLWALGCGTLVLSSGGRCKTLNQKPLRV